MIPTDPSSPGVAHGCPVKFDVGNWRFFNVMAGLVPATHVFTGRGEDVDGLHRAGHDDNKGSSP